MELLPYVILALLLGILLYIGWKIAKKLVINSLLGIASLFILNFFGVGIPINPMTLVIVTLFGLPGIGTLLVIHFWGSQGW